MLMNSTKARQLLMDNSALVTLIVLVIIATFIMGDTFLSVTNIRNILLNNAIVGIIALGMTMIIITGGIDLSVGSLTAACGLAALFVMNTTGSIALGFLAAIGVGVLVGGVNGALVAKFNIPAFIVTLGMMRVIRSLSLHYFRGGGIMIDRNPDLGVAGFLRFSGTRLFNDTIPLPVFYWLGLAVLMAIVCNRTAIGRHMYALGSNEKAAFLSAVNVDKVKIIIYMIAGALVGVAALVEASRIGSMNSASSGIFYELEAIAAVIIGGTAISGGRGRIMGTVYGTLILGVINNLMNLMGLPSFLIGAIQGSIVILAVLLQQIVSRKEKKY